MKRSLKNILNYKIKTEDGKKARIVDFLFDEEKWLVRYMKVDFGNAFVEEPVIIPRVFLTKPLWDENLFLVKMDMKEIEKFPKTEERLPVSRAYEQKVHDFFGLTPYWLNAYTVPLAGAFYPARPVHVPESLEKSDDDEPVLRSFTEVENYQIEAEGGTFGHIEDLVVDDLNWQIEFAVVDTKNWMPWSKKVLVPIEMMDKINFAKRKVSFSLNVDTIREAPVYVNIEEINDRLYEQEIYDYYKARIPQESH
jgi:hypothetical protein